MKHWARLREEAWKLVNNLGYADGTILLAESSFEMTSDESERTCQSGQTKSWLQKKYTTLPSTREALKLLKIWPTLIQPSIRMEAAAKKSREGWASEGQRWKIRKDREQRRVARDRGRDHPHPRVPSYCVQMRKLGREEGWQEMESCEIWRWGRAVWMPRSANKVASGSWSKLSLRHRWRQKWQNREKQKTAGQEADRVRGGSTSREKPRAWFCRSWAGLVGTGLCGHHSFLESLGAGPDLKARNTQVKKKKKKTPFKTYI